MGKFWYFGGGGAVPPLIIEGQEDRLVCEEGTEKTECGKSEKKAGLVDIISNTGFYPSLYICQHVDKIIN